MQAPSPLSVTFLVLVPLLAWRIHSRYRRMVGRQRLSKVRPWITLVIFPSLVLMLALAAQSHAERLGWLAAGLLAGSLLGVYGLRATRFEPTRQGLYYTPHAPLGIALLLLFVARIAYRFFEVYSTQAPPGQNGSDFVRSPLTLAVFGLLAGYYIAYAIGLVRWRGRVMRAKRAREAASGAG